MSNCGCGSGGGGTGTSGCVCRIDSSARISSSGVGSTLSPFLLDLILDPATDNAASLTADGLFVQSVSGPPGGGDVYYNAAGGVVVFDDGLDNTAATHAFSLDGDATVITVLDQRYNANSVEMAVTDNTPVNLQFTPLTVLGMGASGNLRLVDWDELGGGGGGSGLMPDAFGNWDMGQALIHPVGTTNLIYPGVIRNTGGVSVTTNYTITGTGFTNDPQVGTAFLARIDQILDNTDSFGFIGPHGFAPAFPFPNQFKGSIAAVQGSPPAAVFECEGVTQFARDATGFASEIAFQNTKLIKNVSGVAADIAGHQGFLNIPAYLADNASISMARCAPGTLGGPLSQPIGGEYARDGVVALHQGFCDYPAFAVDKDLGGTLSNVVLVSFSSIATFGQGASGAMRHGFRYEDAQTTLHPCLTNETWRVTVTATSGNITLTFGAQTATIPFSSSHAQVQTALEGLSSITAGNVSVTSAGLALDHYVEFVGALKDADLSSLPLTGTGATITNLGHGGEPDFWDANILAFKTLGTLTKQIAVNIPYLEGAVINIGLHNGSTTVNAPTPTQTVTASSLIKANTSHARITSSGHMTFNGAASTFGGGFEDGQEMKVSNMGVFDITFVDITSFPACGLDLPGKNKLTLKPLESMYISWWAAGSMWYVVGGTPGTVLDTGLLHTNAGLTSGRMKVSDYGSLNQNTVQLEAYKGIDTIPVINIGTGGGLGVINWGPGNAATDTTLLRNGTAGLLLTGATGGTGDLTAGGSITSPRHTATGLTGAVTQSRWVGGTVTGPPTTGSFFLNDWITTQAGRMWICVISGTPGTWIPVGSSLPDGIDMTFGTSTGTKIGSASNQLIGFWGHGTSTQPTAPPADATDLATAITLVNSLKTKLRSIGLMA